MKELRNWLDRLHQLSEPQTEPIRLRQSLHRVAAPFAFDFDDSFIRVADTGQGVAVFGALPIHMSVLVRPDFESQSADMEVDAAIAAQLGALMTYAANRRIRVAATEAAISYGGSETYSFLPAPMTDRETLGIDPGDMQGRFETCVAQYGGLAGEDAAAIGQAIDLH